MKTEAIDRTNDYTLCENHSQASSETLVATDIPKNFLNFWYLRAFDLMPERLCKCGRSFTEDKCQELYERGWLFVSEADAMRTRDIMLQSRLEAAIKARGIRMLDVRFVHPKVDEEFAQYVKERWNTASQAASEQS